MRSLPDWFAIEEAIVRYVNEINGLPTFIASQHERAVGFLSVKQHNDYSAEVHVLAVWPAMHRHGIGRQLLVRAEDYLRSRNIDAGAILTD